ncbi:hypothetical protein SK066_14065 [Paenibacillus hunanensis]|uniref:hypothetical protein n=1 Tax=Paenibacillus hunanensis TaxID=539262 RepID=UPI002A69BD8B|nr:hypothetical protein [Paenibacillus hunanensis]WPP39747.1 hypothetical protein SK066_14065 [Paenibacillus hunanensis]
MKKLTTAAKNRIARDWSEVLSDYTIIKPLHWVKRYGPLLIGVYMKPVYGGEHYVPIVHTHSLMTVFPVISLVCPLPMYDARGREESISFIRHSQEFQYIAAAFRSQYSAILTEPITYAAMQQWYDASIRSATDYPVQAMTDAVLLSWWCNEMQQAEALILSYSAMIAIWPAAASTRFGGSAGWEQRVRAQANHEQLHHTATAELTKFKLDTLQDYGLISSD